MPAVDALTGPEQALSSAQFISQHSQAVRIPASGVKRAAQRIQRQMQQSGYSAAAWKAHTLTPSVANSQAIQWIFVIDALNFSFWSDKPEQQQQQQYTVTHNGVPYRGYWSLCAAINRACQEGLDMTDPHVYAAMTKEQLHHVFRTDDPQSQEPMPLLDERLEVLHQVGRVLVDKYQGKLVNLIRQSGNSACRLVDQVVQEFECFRDQHTYKGRRVQFHKRAQILVADIWACFEGQGHGGFTDIDKITMFADYRVPQALCHFGALEYTPELRKHLEQGKELPSGHPWEVEIRGCSIWAVELIRRHLGEGVNAILLDFYMWDYSKEHAREMQKIPIHHTRSIYY